MLGRFLEISVFAPEILESLAFYEALGFIAVPTNEVRDYPYAVVTDGRLFLGLHQRTLPSPTLCFVQPDLQHHAQALTSAGIVVDRAELSQDSFNELCFHDPSGLPIRLQEARTFSPPDIDLAHASSCGYFVELGVPVKSYEAMTSFWESQGFVAFEEVTTPFARLPLTSHHVNLGLHRSRALRHHTLVFEDPDMRERLSHLRERGHRVSDEMPDTLDEHHNGVLIAPEGTRLLLLESSTGD